MYADTTVGAQVGQNIAGVGSNLYTNIQTGSAVSDNLPSWSYTCPTSTCVGYGVSASGAITVNNGLLGASSSITMTGSPATPFFGIADSSADYTDTLTITGGTGSGVLGLTYALDGVISSTGTGNNNSSITFYSNAATTSNYDNEGIQSGSYIQLPATLPVNGTYKDTVTFYIPFTYGTALAIDLNLDASAVVDGDLTPYTATVNYYNTAALTSALVFSGTPSDPVTQNSAADIVSASGLNYGPNGISVVSTPEPGTMSLTFLGVGLLGLIVVMRKREAQGRAQAA